MSETHDIKIARMKAIKELEELGKVYAELKRPMGVPPVPSDSIIEKIISLYNECPIKYWTDLADEDATVKDMCNAQMRWIKEHWDE